MEDMRIQYAKTEELIRQVSELINDDPVRPEVQVSPAQEAAIVPTQAPVAEVAPSSPAAKTEQPATFFERVKSIRPRELTTLATVGALALGGLFASKASGNAEASEAASQAVEAKAVQERAQASLVDTPEVEVRSVSSIVESQPIVVATDESLASGGYNCGNTGELEPGNANYENQIRYLNETPELPEALMETTITDELSGMGAEAWEVVKAKALTSSVTPEDAVVEGNEDATIYAHKMHSAITAENLELVNFTCVDENGNVDVRALGRINLKRTNHVNGFVFDEAGIKEFESVVNRDAYGNMIFETVDLGDGKYMVVMEADGCKNPVRKYVPHKPEAPKETTTTKKETTTTEKETTTTVEETTTTTTPEETTTTAPEETTTTTSTTVPEETTTTVPEETTTTVPEETTTTTTTTSTTVPEETTTTTTSTTVPKETTTTTTSTTAPPQTTTTEVPHKKDGDDEELPTEEQDKGDGDEWGAGGDEADPDRETDDEGYAPNEPGPEAPPREDEQEQEPKEPNPPVDGRPPRETPDEEQPEAPAEDAEPAEEGEPDNDEMPEIPMV